MSVRIPPQRASKQATAMHLLSTQSLRRVQPLTGLQLDVERGRESIVTAKSMQSCLVHGRRLLEYRYSGPTPLVPVPHGQTAADEPIPQEHMRLTDCAQQHKAPCVLDARIFYTEACATPWLFMLGPGVANSHSLLSAGSRVKRVMIGGGRWLSQDARVLFKKEECGQSRIADVGAAR